MNSSSNREIHPDFGFYLGFKNGELINLYKDVRKFILGMCPDANELLYHTHKKDLNDVAIKKLLLAAIDLAIADAGGKQAVKGQTISKIKR